MFHFIAMEWSKAHEHFSCVYNSVNSDKALAQHVQEIPHAFGMHCWIGLLPVPLAGHHPVA